jgi:hypothetical protein
VKLKLLTQNKKIATLLQNNLGYLGNELLSFSTNNNSVNESGHVVFNKATSPKIIVIVARQYYTEAWQTYPALSLKELKSILTLQQKNNSGFKIIQRITINKEQDGFDVKTITFNKKTSELLPPKSVLIPETELLRSLINNNGRLVAQIESPNGSLFWAHSTNKVHSAYKKGLLNNLEAFMQSIGLPEDIAIKQISNAKYAQLLFELIENTAITKLIEIASVNMSEVIDVNRLHRLYLAPLAVATVFVLMSNSYFYLQQSWLSNQIKETSSETSGLLEQRVEIDQVEQLVNVLNDEFSRLKATHATWELLDKAMAAGMRVTRFRRYDQGIELRGTAPQASKVLSEINTLKQVSGAVFVGSVRKSRGQDAFTILLQFSSKQVVNTRMTNKKEEG